MSSSPTGEVVDAAKANGLFPGGVAENVTIWHWTMEDIGRSSFSEIWAAFMPSFAMILFSELGDKTFFIAALMSMKHARSSVLAGAVGALALMTVLSALVGAALPRVINKKYTQIASSVLFLLFGARMLYEAASSTENESHVLEEVELELTNKGSDDVLPTTSLETTPRLTASALFPLRRESLNTAALDGPIRRLMSPPVPPVDCVTNSETIEGCGNCFLYSTAQSLPPNDLVGHHHTVKCDDYVAGEAGWAIGCTTVNNAKRIRLTTTSSSGGDTSVPDQSFEPSRRIASAERVPTRTVAFQRCRRGKFTAAMLYAIQTPSKVLRNLVERLISPVVLQAFVLTFLAEWGDRSQVSTIALAAARNATAVSIGATAGHVVCTAIAVIGGKMLASRISERTVSFCGGALFLLFGVGGMLL